MLTESVPPARIVLLAQLKRMPLTYVAAVVAAFTALPAFQPKAFWVGLVTVMLIVALGLRRRTKIVVGDDSVCLLEPGVPSVALPRDSVTGLTSHDGRVSLVSVNGVESGSITSFWSDTRLRRFCEDSHLKWLDPEVPQRRLDRRVSRHRVKRLQWSIGLTLQATAGAGVGAVFGATVTDQQNAIWAGAMLLLMGLAALRRRVAGSKRVGAFAFPFGVTFGLMSVLVGCARIIG